MEHDEIELEEKVMFHYLDYKNNNEMKYISSHTTALSSILFHPISKIRDGM
jgi:hypothetical protein